MLPTYYFIILLYNIISHHYLIQTFKYLQILIDNSTVIPRTADGMQIPEYAVVLVYMLTSVHDGQLAKSVPNGGDLLTEQLHLDSPGKAEFHHKVVKAISYVSST